MPTPTQGAFAVITNDENKVLMHRRTDLPLWSLPGGKVEPGEMPTDAVIREVKEETGYEIDILRFIGNYWRPQIGHYGDLVHLYTARVIGGEPIKQGPETSAVEWFAPSELPKNVVPEVHERITDAMSDSEHPFRKNKDYPAFMLMVRRIALTYSDFINRVRGNDA